MPLGVSRILGVAPRRRTVPNFKKPEHERTLMFVVLQYAHPGFAPTVMYGEVYTVLDDALAAAREQESVCRFGGRPLKHEVATLTAA